MSRACRHDPNYVVIKYDCTGLPDPLELSWRECLDCGAWLSLGPANDTPEAWAEIRAADLVLDPNGSEWAPTEVLGWRIHELADTDPGLAPRGIGEERGYLARAIATHEDE